MLTYEKFTTEHIPFYYAWRNNPEIAIFDQSEFLRPMSYEEVHDWSMRMVEGTTYLIKQDDVPIGTCAFMNVDQRNRHAELSIVIGEAKQWGKGYGTQVMNQLLVWGFEGMNLERLYLRVFDFNARAIALYEKMGFKREGTMRKMVYRDGAYHDVHIYGLLRSEWK